MLPELRLRVGECTKIPAGAPGNSLVEAGQGPTIRTDREDFAQELIA
jgi:hypothetical protein